GRDRDVAAGLAQRAGEGQPVGPEIPILGGKKEQFRPPLGGLRRQGHGRGGTGQRHVSNRRRYRDSERGCPRPAVLFNASGKQALAETAGLEGTAWHES